MQKRNGCAFILFAIMLTCLVSQLGSPVTAEEGQAPPGAKPPKDTLRLTLDEIKHHVLANNKLLNLAALNVKSKGYATRAVQALYFPQVIGTSVYFRFNDDLGDVLSTKGRNITGPRGTPLAAFPPIAFDIPLINQDSSFSTITAVQPITDLLKVRQGVKLAQADEGIAQAQLEKGTRELISGVEQLFWGILAAERIRSGLLQSAAGAEEMAKTGNLEAKTALVQGAQALQEVDNQLADLKEQLAILLEVLPCTTIELVEPPLPIACVTCAADAVRLALESSPEIKEAEQTINKAHAAVAVAKVDCLPNIAIVGGYANNNMTPVVQTNISFVGVLGTYTFVDWGKRKNTIREREELIAMATLKCQQTHDDVMKNALKAFREYESTQAALKLAVELLGLRQEAFKAAVQPADKFKAAKDLMTAQVDSVKADLNHRIAYVKLMAVIGRQ